MKRKGLKILFAAMVVAALAAPVWGCGMMEHAENGAAMNRSDAATKAAGPMESIAGPYFAMRKALSADSVDGVSTAAVSFVLSVTSELSRIPEEKKGVAGNVLKSAQPLARKGLKLADRVIPCSMGMGGMVDKMLFGEDDAANRTSLEKLRVEAQALAPRKLSIQDARSAFGTLSDDFAVYLRQNAGAEEAKEFQIYYCEMAKRFWVQRSGEKIGNPYLGAAMPECGTPVAWGSGARGDAAGSKSEGHKH